MTSLLYGAVGAYPVPADENVVRMTTSPVTPDAPAAMAEDAPEMGEVETDPNPSLGMATRQLASTWHEPKKYAPAWADNATARHDAIVNERWASSGTAAQREANGEFGHGTIAYAEGIEPVGDLRDGGKMGNEYFVTDPKNIQRDAINYMTVPPGSDADTTASLAGAAATASRNAATASAYRSMWEGVLNGD